MLKDSRQKRKSNHRVISDLEKTESSNFSSGSIKLTTEQLRQETLNKINDLGGLPSENEHIRIVTRKAINSFDFILAILAEHKIEELTIAFYRISKKVINELSEIQKSGDIGKITFLLNDGFPKLVPEAWNLIKSFESQNWVLKLENNHTKIILCDTQKGAYIVEGSGNLSINARIEQYCFDNSLELYNFHKNWIDGI